MVTADAGNAVYQRGADNGECDINTAGSSVIRRYSTWLCAFYDAMAQQSNTVAGMEINDNLNLQCGGDMDLYLRQDQEIEANKGRVLYRHDLFFIWRQMEEAKKMNADMAKKKAKEMASGVAYQNGSM